MAGDYELALSAFRCSAWEADETLTAAARGLITELDSYGELSKPRVACTASAPASAAHQAVAAAPEGDGDGSAGGASRRHSYCIDSVGSDDSPCRGSSCSVGGRGNCRSARHRPAASRRLDKENEERPISPHQPAINERSRQLAAERPDGAAPIVDRLLEAGRARGERRQAAAAEAEWLREQEAGTSTRSAPEINSLSAELVRAREGDCVDRLYASAASAAERHATQRQHEEQMSRALASHLPLSDVTRRIAAAIPGRDRPVSERLHAEGMERLERSALARSSGVPQASDDAHQPTINRQSRALASRAYERIGADASTPVHERLGARQALLQSQLSVSAPEPSHAPEINPRSERLAMRSHDPSVAVEDRLLSRPPPAAQPDEPEHKPAVNPASERILNEKGPMLPLEVRLQAPVGRVREATLAGLEPASHAPDLCDGTIKLLASRPRDNRPAAERLLAWGASRPRAPPNPGLADRRYSFGFDPAEARAEEERREGERRKAAALAVREAARRAAAARRDKAEARRREAEAAARVETGAGGRVEGQPAEDQAPPPRKAPHSQRQNHAPPPLVEALARPSEEARSPRRAAAPPPQLRPTDSSFAAPGACWPASPSACRQPAVLVGPPEVSSSAGLGTVGPSSARPRSEPSIGASGRACTPSRAPPPSAQPPPPSTPAAACLRLPSAGRGVGPPVAASRLPAPGTPRLRAAIGTARKASPPRAAAPASFGTEDLGLLLAGEEPPVSLAGTRHSGYFDGTPPGYCLGRDNGSSPWAAGANVRSSPHIQRSRHPISAEAPPVRDAEPPLAGWLPRGPGAQPGASREPGHGIPDPAPSERSPSQRSPGPECCHTSSPSPPRAALPLPHAFGSPHEAAARQASGVGAEQTLHGVATATQPPSTPSSCGGNLTLPHSTGFQGGTEVSRPGCNMLEAPGGAGRTAPAEAVAVELRGACRASGGWMFAAEPVPRNRYPTPSVATSTAQLTSPTLEAEAASPVLNASVCNPAGPPGEGASVAGRAPVDDAAPASRAADGRAAGSVPAERLPRAYLDDAPCVGRVGSPTLSAAVDPRLSSASTPAHPPPSLASIGGSQSASPSDWSAMTARDAALRAPPSSEPMHDQLVIWAAQFEAEREGSLAGSAHARAGVADSSCHPDAAVRAKRRAGSMLGSRSPLACASVATDWNGAETGSAVAVGHRSKAPRMLPESRPAEGDAVQPVETCAVHGVEAEAGWAADADAGRGAEAEWPQRSNCGFLQSCGPVVPVGLPSTGIEAELAADRAELSRLRAELQEARTEAGEARQQAAAAHQEAEAARQGMATAQLESEAARREAAMSREAERRALAELEGSAARLHAAAEEASRLRAVTSQRDGAEAEEVGQLRHDLDVLRARVGAGAAERDRLKEELDLAQAEARRATARARRAIEAAEEAEAQLEARLREKGRELTRLLSQRDEAVNAAAEARRDAAALRVQVVAAAAAAGRRDEAADRSRVGWNSEKRRHNDLYDAGSRVEADSRAADVLYSGSPGATGVAAATGSDSERGKVTGESTAAGSVGRWEREMGAAQAEMARLSRELQRTQEEQLGASLRARRKERELQQLRAARAGCGCA